MNRKNLIQEYVLQHKEETLELLLALAKIPAPLGGEAERARYVLKWLHQKGAREAYIDAVGNVVFPYQCREDQPISVRMAHMDVVCPDQEPLPVRLFPDRLVGPGVRDDTANLVNMLMAIGFLMDHPVSLPMGLLFVADVGEEGLGNLRGSRHIMETYGERIKEWISFDLNCDILYHRAVGSERFRITAVTKGGHSYQDFGEKNAIAALAELIVDFYHQKLPEKSGLTYNVGTIEGGTSVNTIAGRASLLYEFRSDSEQELRWMEEQFQQILERHQSGDCRLEVETIGIRPGNGNIDADRQRQLEDRCLRAIELWYPGKVSCKPGSTDSNIPLSRGIPAVTVGLAMGGNTHTREEWVSIESLELGQKIALELII